MRLTQYILFDDTLTSQNLCHLFNKQLMGSLGVIWKKVFYLLYCYGCCGYVRAKTTYNGSNALCRSIASM